MSWEQMSQQERDMRVAFELCDHNVKQHGFDHAMENPPVRRCLEILARVRNGQQTKGAD